MRPIARAAAPFALALLGSVVVAGSAAAVERPAPLPEPLARVDWKPVEAQVATLSNGLEVVVVPDPGSGLVDVRLLVGVGEYVDPADKVGLSRAAFELLVEGTDTASADELSAALRRLGANLTGELASGNTGVVRLTTLSSRLGPALDLWSRSITSPAFSDRELATWKSQQKAELARNDRDPSYIAGRAFWRIVYGDGYIGRAQTAASIDAITADELRALHARHVGPLNAVVLVGGDVTKAEIVPLLEERLGSWNPSGTEPAPVVATPQPVEQPVLYFIDNPGAAQSHIRVGTTVPAETDPQHFALQVANQAFGGAFTSRLNMNLREEKAITYGARCWTTHLHGEGQLGCGTSVTTPATGQALTEIRRELTDVLGPRPLSEEEVRTSRESLAQQWPMELETVAAKLGQELRIWRYGLPEDWTTGYAGRIEAVTTSQANDALKAAVSPDRTFWLVVGDGAQIRDELEAYGLPIVVLDAYGQPTD